MSCAYTWGTTPEERDIPYNCDRFWDGEGVACTFHRGVTVDATPEVIYRWLCQLRVAPYSYDWIDNFCRRSPRTLTPGLDDLSIGTVVCGGARIVDFEPGRSITMHGLVPAMAYLRLTDILATYLIVPRSDGACRLLAKGICCFTNDAPGRLACRLTPWADLIMMRKQLLNLKALSESSVRSIL